MTVGRSNVSCVSFIAKSRYCGSWRGLFVKKFERQIQRKRSQVLTSVIKVKTEADTELERF